MSEQSIKSSYEALKPFVTSGTLVPATGIPDFFIPDFEEFMSKKPCLSKDGERFFYHSDFLTWHKRLLDKYGMKLLR